MRASVLIGILNKR